jgi:hypothetical protein
MTRFRLVQVLLESNSHMSSITVLDRPQQMPYVEMRHRFAYAWASQLQQFTHIMMQLSHGHSSTLRRSRFSRSLSLSLSLQCEKFLMQLCKLLTTVL